MGDVVSEVKSPLNGAAPLQPVAATVADLQLVGVYVPAGPGPEPIAGDFWDVLVASPQQVVVLVGDVSGHGPPAVERMRALRTAARDCVAAGARPASLLKHLDAFCQALGPEDLATLWAGLYTPGTGELVYSSAGHPPPALRSPGSPTTPLASADAPPLGTGFVGDVREHEVRLEPGAVLVAYSDGLIERHDRHLDEQMALLAALVDASCDPAAPSPDRVAAAVLEALVPDPGQAQDDVCLLVLQRQTQLQVPAPQQA